MAVKINLTKLTVALGVGDLVAEPATNTGRAAGLRQATRFALGREAHIERQRAQAARNVAYRQEIFVRHTTTVDEFAVKIQGRIDGVIEPPAGGSWLVEEVKSVVLSALAFAALTPHPQHLEQLRLYCYFVALEGRPVAGQLVYVNVVWTESAKISQ